MTPPNVLARIRELCDAASRGIPPGQERDTLSVIRERLDEPVRVAVAGRVSTGKSTLVNALVGKSVAPTGASETTKVVTWFRYGYPPLIEVEHVDGSRREHDFVDHRLPHTFGSEIASIRRAVVTLAEAPLRHMTLIDTPGLNSPTDTIRDQAERVMHASSATAVAEADALVFLFTQTVREEDVHALERFSRSVLTSQHASAARAIGVLSRADTLGHGDLRRAHEVAAELTAALRPLVATVLPLAGRWAETAATGSLTEEDARALKCLAGLDAVTLEDDLLASGDEFVHADAPVAATARAHLLSLLGLTGVRRLIDSIRSDVDGAGALRVELTRLSGIGAIRRCLHAGFEGRADLLKANAALRALEQLAFRPAQSEGVPGLAALLRGVEAMRDDRAMHALDELWALEQCAYDGSAIPDALRQELVRIATHQRISARLGVRDDASAEHLRQAALAGAGRWRAFRNEAAATRVEERISEIAIRSYTIMLIELESAA